MLGMKFWQEVIILVGITLIIIMILYPPWYITARGVFKHVRLNHKYNFIFTPPSNAYHIDYQRYLWSIGVACFMLLLAFLEFIPDR